MSFLWDTSWKNKRTPGHKSPSHDPGDIFICPSADVTVRSQNVPMPDRT